MRTCCRLQSTWPVFPYRNISSILRIVNMDSENQQTLSMEFGDFTGLPASDQAYINKILFSTESSCKEGKKPEFAWIDNVTNAGNTSRVSHGDVASREVGDGTVPLPNDSAIPPAVGVMTHVVPPPYGYPIPYGTPFLQYTPGMPVGMPVPATSVQMIPPPVTMYGYQPQPIPSDITYMQTNDNAHVPNEQVTPVNNAQETNSLETQQKESHENQMTESGRKLLPRRNKKKRPPGYYEELEARQQQQLKADQENTVEVSEANEETSNVQASNYQPAIPVNDNTPSDYANQQVPSSSELSNSTELHQIPSPPQTQYAVQEQQYKTESEQHVKNETVQSLVESCDSSQVEPKGDVSQSVSNSHLTCHVVSQSQIETTQNSQSVQNSNELSNTQLTSEREEDSSQTNCEFASSSQGHHKIDTQKEQALQEHGRTGADSSETVDAAVKSTVDSTQVVSDNTASLSDKTVAASGNVSNALITDSDSKNTEAPIEKKVPEPTQPKKPTSWAGLFTSTKQAQAATVIYTDRKKDVVAVEIGGEKASTPASTTTKDSKPEVVPVADDKSAKLIAERVSQHRLNHKALALIPRGLTNRKNWCYVNATLQALLACPPFYHLMKALPAFPDNSRGPSSSPFIDALVRFVNEFSSMHQRGAVEKAKWLNAKGTMTMDIPQGATFEPTYVYDVLRLEKYAAHFILGRQEDAEEFLSCVLNGMHEEMVATLGLINPPPQHEALPQRNGDIAEEHSPANEAVIDEDGWEQVGPKNKAVITRSTNYSISPISQVFQGQIRSILHQPGARESATLQPFFTLQLDIQSDKVWSVKDALENLVKKESLQDYTCTKTKQEIEASRRIVLEELPPVLILHLKYFVYDKSGGSQKLTKHIDFTENLEISKEFLSPNIRSKLTTSQRKYKLFAVVNHHGSRLLGGHYTTYVYHCGVNGWIHIDDEIVRTVKVDSMLKHNPPKVPYLLYYRKVDLQT